MEARVTTAGSLPGSGTVLLSGCLSTGATAFCEGTTIIGVVSINSTWSDQRHTAARCSAMAHSAASNRPLSAGCTVLATHS